MPRRPHYPLSEQEVRGMFAKSQGRDRVLLTLLWRAGLRNFEACALTEDDVELMPDSSARLNIRHGKGDKQRYAGLDKRSADVLRGWLEKRHECAEVEAGSRGPRTPYLLQTSTGQPLHTSQARRTIRLLAAKAGIRHRVHPHALRHRFARELYDEGHGVRTIQLALGHASLQQTQTYLQSLGCHEAVEAVAGRDW